MPRKRVIHPPDMYPTAGYARAVQVGDTLYISGHIPKNDRNEIVAIGDVERQADQVFQNIGRVLAAAGSTYDDLVRMIIYALSPDYRLPSLAVRDRYVKRETYASTYIVPQALAAPELLLEDDDPEKVHLHGKGRGVLPVSRLVYPGYMVETEVMAVTD